MRSVDDRARGTQSDSFFSDAELVKTELVESTSTPDLENVPVQKAGDGLFSIAQLSIEILRRAQDGHPTQYTPLMSGRVLEVKVPGLTDSRVMVSVSSKLWTWIKSFLTKLLGLFYANPSWRSYEKYHYLSEQTLQGIDRILQDSRSPLNASDRSAMQQWMTEVKSLGFIPQKPNNQASIEDKARFHLQSALISLQRASDAKKEEGIDCRKCHKAFLEHLRQALELNADSSQGGAIFTLAHEICFSMYTQCNMTSFGKSLVDFVTGKAPELSSSPTPGSASSESSLDGRFEEGEALESMATGINDPTHVSLDVLEARLHEVQSLHGDIKRSANARKIGALPKVGQSVRGELSFLGFDPNLQGNPPYRKFDVVTCEGQRVSNLRLPTPTMGKRITPEFLGYLQALRARGMKHTYINLQNNRGHDGEGIRSRLLQGLGKEFADVLTVVTLDKNSDFYFQRNKFAQASMPADTFKEQLQARLLHEKVEDVPTGCYLPDSLRDSPSFQQALDGIIQGVHQHFFGNRTDLTHDERKHFIEIVYTLTIDAIVKETGASFYNNSCKDCIDRGGGANALMYYTLSMLSRGQRDASEQQASDALLASMTYSDAIWARKREIIEERLDRAVEAGHAMLSAQREALAMQKRAGRSDDAQTPFDWLRSQMHFQSASISGDFEQNIQA